jgi:hypothetical protein
MMKTAVFDSRLPKIMATLCMLHVAYDYTLIVLVILPSAWRQYDAAPSQTSPANAISKTDHSKASPSYIPADATSLDPPLTVY